MTSDSTAEAAFEKRVYYLKRLFARGVGKAPSAKIKLALARAAMLTARAELAANDPATSANDMVRLDGAASKARRDLQTLIDRKGPEQEMTLAKYAAMQRKASAT